MKRLPTVESVMTQVRFSPSRVEKYFNNTHFIHEGVHHKFSDGFESITCRSTGTVAKGFVRIVFAKGEESAMISIDIPTSAHFLVTGIRTYRQPYKIAFAVSLS